jgi:methylmalonyl-CoA mutase N-terminal domain/subunit
MVSAIEEGFPQREIERRAFEHQRAIEEGRRIVVGQNQFVDDPNAPSGAAVPLHHLDPAIEQAQVQRLAGFRKQRNPGDLATALGALENTARGADNLLPAILAAIKARATLGEIADVLRDVFGEHRPG